MEQVTEAVKAETTENRENREYRKPAVKWLIIGLIVSLAASGIFTACYGIFERRAESRRNEQYIADPLETSNTITYLYQNCYLLYRDLYNKEHQTSLSYVELYMQPTEGNEWLNDDRKRAEVAYGDTEELTIPEGADPENYAAQGILAAQTGEYLEEHFNTLENSFGQLNNLYDYRIRDTQTGEILSNLADTDIVAEEQCFYLTFVFDAYGNDATLGNTVIGSDTTTLRKTAAEVIRNCGLTRMVDANMGTTIDAGHNTMFRLEMPKNCEITFCISRQAAQSLGQNGQFIYYDQDMNNVSVYFSMGEYESYYLSGCQQVFLILALLIFLLALAFPGLGEERAWEKVMLLKLPVEAIVVILTIIAGIGSEQVVGLVSWVRSGHALSTVLRGNSAQILLLTIILTYALNVLAVAALFFITWCCGVSLRAIRVQGAGTYLRQHSLCYLLVPLWKKLWRGMKRGFSIGRDKVVDVYHDAEHFDVTKDAKKLILRIVLWNALILVIVCSLPLGGVTIAVIYSVVLYFVLRRYVSKLQKKYGLLLKATNEIAQGNLNVTIEEDLGVFEPFKPQIYRIEEGFRNAVAEEVKSQRMKSELITNVSHDLKTPLTAIITYVKLLQEPGVTEEQRKEYLETLDRKSLRLKALIEDLFEVSKANSQNITLDIRDVDIVSMVKQVEFEMEDKLADAGLDVRMSMPEEKVIVPLDSQKTFRIFENLFGNIAKYALPGTRVYVNGFTAKDDVTIILKNITAQELSVSGEELTERFVRGDVSRNTEGSGLGLAIAKSFTELQGGKFRIELDGDLFKVVLIWKVKQESGNYDNSGDTVTAGEKQPL
ncbi:sensor histidine kinase [Clostridium sp. AM34-9AC]|uniref:sensor histidine kinase n=1 Tax=Clostridium sp. AM34-9AC TaxID=2293030 RepID=UPI000E547689|nr:sensor histidine kinase [Clostridium sp. AM34-9AC]RHT17428.1 sensor histidine kinase [Clostridium sp. AM34-9AC]